MFGKKHLPYLAVVSHAFLLASLYEIEKNKMIIYFTYRTADLTASVSKGNEQKERVMRKREEIERKLNEALLHAMVPKKVAEKLKAGRKVMPEEFSEVTIFFSDVEGFTNICAQVNPIQVVNMLNELYTVMDYCTSLFPLYKGRNTVSPISILSTYCASVFTLFKGFVTPSLPICTPCQHTLFMNPICTSNQSPY